MPESSPLSLRTVDRHLAELDVLRGVAALSVVLYHLTFFIAGMFPGVAPATLRVTYGWYGVQLFFAISGFVILMTIDRTVSARRFIAARFWRLVPTYWLAMAITFVVVRAFGPERLQVDAVDVAANLTLLQWFIQPVAAIRMVDGAYWSLNVEIIFYAAMLALWRLRVTGRIETVLMGWMALKWIAVFLPEPTDRLLLLDQIVYFAIGIASYRVWSGQRSAMQQAPICATLVATVLVTSFPDQFALTFALIALFAAIATGRLGWLRFAPLQWLGAVSYSLYLLHGYIGYTLILTLTGRGMAMDAAVVVSLLTVLALSAVVTFGFERPLARAVRRPATRRPALDSAAAPI